MIRQITPPTFPKRRAAEIYYLSPASREGSPVLIPAVKWCKENNFTYRQLKRLMRQKQVLAITHRRRLYVCTCPLLQIPLN